MSSSESIGRSGPSLLIVVSVALTGCGGGAPTTIEDRERGCRYVLPPGWAAFDNEARSRDGSLLTLRVYDLDGADRRFILGLPDSIFPKLEEWTRHFYILDGPPSRAETVIGGVPAAELTHPVRVRPRDPVSKVTYWVVRRGSRLFVLRAAYPPAALAHDEPDVRRILASWSFI